MTQKFFEPKIGDKLPDGTTYAGISPDTGKRMYASVAFIFNEEKKHPRARLFSSTSSEALTTGGGVKSPLTDITNPTSMYYMSP
jgi:hypothetical protein